MEHTEFKAVIYINPNQHNINTIDQLNRTRSILSEYWDPVNILIVNCGHDYALQKWLREESGGQRKFPQIYIGDVRIGFLEDLKSAQQSGLLALMSDQNMSSSLRLSIVPGDMNSDEDETEDDDSEEVEEDLGPDFVKQHVVTSWFDAGSWLINAAKGVFNFLDTPLSEDDWRHIPSDNSPAPVRDRDMNALLDEEVSEDETVEDDDNEELPTTIDNVASSPNPASPPIDLSVSNESEKKKEEEFKPFDLDFVRTNWLWRAQSRVYRFKKNEFERLEKTAAVNGSEPTERVCAVFPYSIVAKVDKIDDKNVIIRFNNGTEDQHLSSDSADRVTKLIETINHCNLAAPAPVL